MSSDVINIMVIGQDINELVEDLTDEFYETGIKQIKQWLVSNISNTSERVIRDMDTETLLDLFLDSSMELMGIALRHKNGP